MQPIITGSNQYEKMDNLLKSLFSEPDATIPLGEFGKNTTEIDQAEIDLLKDILIRDGAIEVLNGPRGPEVTITEAGIDFFICGGYSRDWSEWSRHPLPFKIQPRSKFWIGFITGLLVLATLILFYFTGKIHF